jgi:uncharacterized phage protein gp47/JayE
MAINPDFVRYTDLRLLDKDPEDIYEAGKLVLQSRNPEWVPEETNVEVMLMQAMSMLVAEAIYSLNQLPKIQVQAQLALLGVERNAGTPPTVNVEFETVGSAGLVIPADTVVVLVLETGDVFNFETDSELIIPEDSTTGTVSATSIEYGSEANGVPTGTTLDLLNDTVDIYAVTTASDVANGQDAESDDVWLERGLQRLQRLTETLVVPQHFINFSLENPNVARCTVIDAYEPPSGTPGSDGGHICVVVYGIGAPLSTEQKEELQEAIEEVAAANLIIHIIDPTVVEIDVVVEVVKFPEYENAVVEANITAALNDYLSPQTWPWAQYLRYNELIALISNVEGVDYVSNLSTPSGDVDLGDSATLTTPDDYTITVV